MLRDIREFSYQEIADKLGLPEGTVKSRINRGRLELARQIHRLQEMASPGHAAADAPAQHRPTGAPE
jgi:RNA polymerase sigma-70 factor (ECF subfamily)